MTQPTPNQPPPMLPPQFDTADVAFIALVGVAFNDLIEGAPVDVRQTLRDSMVQHLNDEAPAIRRQVNLAADEDIRLTIFHAQLADVIENHPEHQFEALRHLLFGA